MIAGREETDSGSIIRQNGLHMAYLSQNPAYEKEDTVLSFVTVSYTHLDVYKRQG